MRLLTVAEYAALGETEPGYTELMEGRLLTSPSPVAEHYHIGWELTFRLRSQLPDGLEAIPAVVELDLNRLI